MVRPSAQLKRLREKSRRGVEVRNLKRLKAASEKDDTIIEDLEEDNDLENSWIEVSDDEEETQSDDDIEPHETSTEVEIVESARNSESIPLFTVMCKSGDVDLSSTQILENWKLSVQRQQSMDPRGMSARTQRRKHKKTVDLAKTAKRLSSSIRSFACQEDGAASEVDDEEVVERDDFVETTEVLEKSLKALSGSAYANVLSSQKKQCAVLKEIEAVDQTRYCAVRSYISHRLNGYFQQSWILFLYLSSGALQGIAFDTWTRIVMT
jgi:hypothetical protein